MKRICLWVLLTLLLSLCACQTRSPSRMDGRFSIRRLNTAHAIDDLVTLDPAEFSCEDEVLIASEELIHYDWTTHTFTLTAEAAARLNRQDLIGTPFVVCVDEDPIYVGVFWSSYFSRSYDGIVIDLLALDQGPKLHIATAYPESPESFRGQDRRSDVRIWRALYAAGKVP